MRTVLSLHEERRYRDQGIVFPLRVLSAAEAAQFRLACDQLESRLGGRPRTVEVRQMHLHFGWAYRLATLPRALDAVSDILGPDLLVTATELFSKHPQETAVSIGWHRDGPYMGLDPERTLTAWIALTDCTLENGCMRFVPEADRRATAGWQTSASGDHDGSENRRPSAEEQIGDVVLEAGEMSLHDVHVLHGSGPNRSAQKRVGFAVRFTTPEGRPKHGRPPAILARGQDRYGNFELAQPPADDDAPGALDGMRLAARRHLDATLQNLKQTARS
ncbi:MAG: phytanoyl-CoA dioxygenase family protein [Planctomycetaceae bacterium]|nr:phytanoyl-CoA dioxygenase family protein [Planctomycetaceae bacterium]